MTFLEFTDFVVTHLWKSGDSVVITALPTLISLAEAELNRSFKVADRDKVVNLTMTSNVVPMPNDVRTIRNVHVKDFGDFSYAAPAHYRTQLDGAAYANLPLAIYTTVKKTIHLSIMASVAVPRTLTLTYAANIPKFQDTDESWLADEYFDVYLYCVLKHTAPFLREDERLAVWQQLFTDAFASAMQENDDNLYAGSPLAIRFAPHA